MSRTPGRSSRLVLAGGLAAMTVLHLAQPRVFESMIPRWLPGDRSAWNLAATAAEGTSAVLLAREETAGAGARLAFLTFLGVWVANIDVAVRGGYRLAPGWLATREAAWLRVPLQLPLLVWAARIARRQGR